jgi:hypothetical protein
MATTSVGDAEHVIIPPPPAVAANPALGTLLTRAPVPECPGR